MSIKVLHIIIKSSYDGAAVYPVRLCTYLKEYDHEIVSCFKGNAYQEILNLGIKCENLLSTHNISYKYLLLKYWRFFKYIRKKSFDIIHYHQSGVGILLLAFLLRKKAKVIHHLHSGNLIGDNTKESISFFHLIVLKYLSDRTYQVAVAQHVFDEYSSKVKQTQNLAIIKNSSPYVFIKKERKTNSVGYIGRFTKEKGFPLLIDIANNLKENKSDLRLILMGEESKLFKQDYAQEADYIEVITPSFNVDNFYKSIDLVLFLSSAPESLPLVVLEAISFDVGVITFPLAGVKEILGNNYPLYIKGSDEVIEKLNWCYSNKINLVQLSSFHKTISEKHSYEEMLSSIRKLYLQLL